MGTACRLSATMQAFLAVSLHWLRSMTSLYSRRSTNFSPVGLYWYSQFQLTCMTSEPWSAASAVDCFSSQPDHAP